MFPILVIAIGIAVLAFGKRLAVLGAAVGAMLGVVVLRIIPGTSSSPLLALLIIIMLAVIGFFVAGFAKGIINIVLIVLGALAGAEIMVGFLDLFGLASGLLGWVLALVGGVIGVVLVQRLKDWAMIDPGRPDRRSAGHTRPRQLVPLPAGCSRLPACSGTGLERVVQSQKLPAAF